MAYQGRYGGGGNSSTTARVIAREPGGKSWSEYETGDPMDPDDLFGRRNGWELPTDVPDPRR